MSEYIGIRYQDWQNPTIPALVCPGVSRTSLSYRLVVLKKSLWNVSVNWAELEYISILFFFLDREKKKDAEKYYKICPVENLAIAKKTLIINK